MSNWAAHIFQRKNDRSESHGDPIVKLEERIDQIRQACQAVGKKLLACLQLHGVEQDKYQKKLPEFILSNQLLETSRTFGKQDALGETFSLCAEAEQKMAEKRWDYEKDLESKVMTPLQIMLEKDIPAIVKLRKQVSKLTQDFDTAKSKYLAAQRQTQSLSGQNAISVANAKNNQLREDMEDAENKLEQMKDQLATEVFNFYAHEGELNNVLLQIIETQSVYYRSIVDVLDDALPKIKHQIGKSAKRPVYGCPLDDHLQYSGRTIASVIEECTTTLQKIGMDEEGLFRIAGGTTKVRKLKAAFDANLVDMDDFTTDPHCIAGALKLYLRELPEPLMTFELYSEWMKVLNLPADQKVPALTSVLNKMNKSHLDNLSYLIKFLARLAANASANKMSANNIAIVVGPNLIWSSHNDRSSIQAIAAQSAVVELLIANANTLFFAKDSEFSRPSNVATYETLASTDAMQTSILSSDSSLSSTNQPYSKESIPKFGSSSSLSSDTTWPEVYPSISSIDDPTSLKTATGDSDSGDRTPHAPRRRKAMAPMPPPMFSDNANEASQETTSLSGTEEETIVLNQTKFAISQALVSGVLNKPKKTLLTRPTTAYADKNVALVPLTRSFSNSADPVDLLEHDSNSGKMEKNGSGDHSRLSETSSLDSLERRKYEDMAKMKPKVPPPPRPDSKETKPQTGGILRVSKNHGSNDPEFQTTIAQENHQGSETSKLPDAKTLERQISETCRSVEGDTRKPNRPSKPQRPAQSKQEQKSAESAIAGVADEVPIAAAGVAPTVTPAVTSTVTGASVAATAVTPAVTPAVTGASVAATAVTPAVTAVAASAVTPAVTGASVTATAVTLAVTPVVTEASVAATVAAAPIASTGSSVEAAIDAAVSGEDELKSNGGIVGGAKPRKPPPPVVRPSISNDSEVEKHVVEEDTYL